MLVVCQLLTLVIALVLAAGSQPMWKKILKSQSMWEGYYHHNGEDFWCSFTAHSTAYIHFVSEYITADMEVSSNDSETVTFENPAVYETNGHFDRHTDLKIVGYFIFSGSSYRFVGNMSTNETENFGTLNLAPSATLIQGRSNSETNLRYGLAIGIPIGCSIILMVSAVLIMRWGIKKGYLRHVPWAYKQFTNPRRARADIEMRDSEDQNSGDQTEVHI